MPWHEARQVLRTASTLGGFFTVETDPIPPGPWRPLAELDVDTLRARVRVSRDLLAVAACCPGKDIEERVVASVVVQGLAARLLAPAFGAAVLGGIAPQLDGDHVHWQPLAPGPVPLAVSHAFGEPVTTAYEAASALHRGVLEPLIRPLVTVALQVARLAPRLLWGNLASVVGALPATIAAHESAHAETARALARSLLDCPPLADLGTYDVTGSFRRRTCCLFYRVPGAGTCGDCPLPAARHITPPSGLPARPAEKD